MSAHLRDRGICRVIVRQGCRTLADKRCHAGNRLPRVNRAGPRACRCPPWTRNRTGQAEDCQGKGRARPPRSGRHSRRKAGLSAPCLLARRARCRTGAHSWNGNHEEPASAGRRGRLSVRYQSAFVTSGSLRAVISRNSGRGKFSCHHWLEATCCSDGCGSVSRVMTSPLSASTSV